MTTTSKTESAAKKDVSKLQRAIVDGMEDVKAQDIQVFDTEHLSPLFERIIVASGTSNRQTRAIAASVRDKVRDAGFPKPRMEGEENGEWIIVDCGAAVAHIMQPTIRQYYRLEELWGDTPVRLKIGAPKPAAASAEAKVPVKTAARRAAKAEAEAQAAGLSEGAPAAKKPAAKKAAAKTTAKPAARKTSSRAPAAAAAAESSAAPAVKKPAARKTAGTTAATKAPIKTVVVKPRAEKVPAKKAGAKTAAAKPAARKTAAPRKPS